jgi:hypothetical protein
VLFFQPVQQKQIVFHSPSVTWRLVVRQRLVLPSVTQVLYHRSIWFLLCLPREDEDGEEEEEEEEEEQMEVEVEVDVGVNVNREEDEDKACTIPHRMIEKWRNKPNDHHRSNVLNMFELQLLLMKIIPCLHRKLVTNSLKTDTNVQSAVIELASEAAPGRATPVT